MFDLDRWQEILNILWMNKLRTVITGISVAWAIFMLVFLMGGGNGLQNGVDEMFADDAVNSMWIWTGSTSVPYQGLPVGREVNLENNDYDRVKKMEGVRYITGRYNVWGEFSIKSGQKTGVFPVRSVHPGHKHIENTLMTHGRYINEQDNAEFRKVAVIGKLVSENFFKSPEDALGKWMDIKGVQYQVVGVFEDAGGDREMQMIYLPVRTAQLAYNGNNRLDQMMVEVGDLSVGESTALAEKIRKEMARKYKFDPDDKKAVNVSNGLEDYQRMQTMFFGIKFIIILVGLLTLLAGIIAVSNIMLITVKERTKEIGVKKALGATPSHIIGTIMQESIFITLIAGYLGLVAGIAVLWSINAAMIAFEAENDFFRNPEISWEMAVGSVFLLVFAGAIGGLIPAYQAAKISPVEAMSA